MAINRHIHVYARTRRAPRRLFETRRLLALQPNLPPAYKRSRRLFEGGFYSRKYGSNIWIENTFTYNYWVNTMVRKLSFIRTNTKSQGLVPAHFALIIIIVVHVYIIYYNYGKTSISINKYNDAGFLKHVAS